MARYQFIVLFVSLAVVVALENSTSENDNQNLKKKPDRNGRKYTSFYSNLNFDDKIDETEAPEEKPVYSDSGLPKPLAKGDKTFSDKSDYKFPEYTKGYPIVPYTFKGFPYYGPYYYGENTEEMPKDQMMDMMEMMNALNKLQGSSKKEEKGILATLFSEPKIVALAAMFPLAIMLATFAPVIMNYIKPSPGMPSTITTIANSKMARALTDKENLESTLQILMEFGEKAFSKGECFQKAFCELALQHGGKNNMKNIATVVNKLGKKDWLKSFHAKHLVEGLEHGDCTNVCHRSARHHKHRSL
nr:uncharacterized protein LOC107443887 [Parasteatoda tepidariorum]